MITRIKSILRRLLPFLLPVATFPVFLYDYIRYCRYSGTISYKSNPKKIIGKVMVNTHVIEKGLTMPEVRLGFGYTKIEKLIDDCFLYLQKYNNGEIDYHIKHAVEVLNEYKEYHFNYGYELDKTILLRINQLSDKSTITSHSRQFCKDKSQIFASSYSCFEDFALSRKSVRGYSNEKISLQKIHQAVELSKYAPCSCNRQSSRVHVFTNQKHVNDILNFQGGNKGFGHLATMVIVITVDLSYYHAVFERNEPLIDGGIFAMNLIYALHSKGIATCSLNTCFSKKRELQLRKIAAIPKSESLIMMIACGLPLQTIKYTVSGKYPTSSFIIHHE